MAIAKYLIIFLVVITQINAEMFPSFSQNEDQRTPHKIILRSKRQQCVCVSVTFPNTADEFDPLTSSFQCSCDSSSSTSATSSSSYNQSPLQRQFQQQQELQRELQQVQQSPRSQSTSCGCQLAPQFTSTSTPTTAWSAVSFGTTQNPYDFFQTLQSSNNNNINNNEIGNNNIQPLFDCQCITVPQQNNIDTSQNNIHPGYNPTAYNPTSYNQPPQQYPRQQQLQQSESQQLQYSQQQQQVPQFLPPPTTTTTTTPAPPPSTTTAPSYSAPQNSPNSPRCKCVEIQILLQDPQIQCDCTGQQGNGQETRPPFPPPQQYTTTTTRIPFPQYTTTTTQGYYQTTTPMPSMTASTRGAPSVYTTPTPLGPTRPPTSGPDALPCVMIHIRTGQKVCACQENYKQCTENVCCNIDKYSSLKSNDDPPHSPPSAGAATVDLLVDLLQKVRESLV
uniref:Uncharacterized protein n=1 Tax=Panagrolaimus superbus TaxID=310955 RepID=A0A914Z2U3_9BILA